MKHLTLLHNFYKRFSLLLYLLIISCVLLAQTSLNNIQVDKLTDDQVKELVKKAETTGMSQQQAEAALLAKGMKPEEIQKLKDRINKLNLNEQKPVFDATSETTRFSEEPTDITTKKEENKVTEIEKKIFGYSLFNSKNLTFEPSLNLPTPQNYQIGPGDQIIIDIWGASQAYYKLKVNPEGTINIDNVGPVFINGLSIENASKKVIARLSSIYAGLISSNPNTFAQVSLGNMRSIKVSIIGEVRLPGTYTLPSLATVFNALYVSGGPNKNGSFRNILVYRENKLISTLDAYDFLIKGDQKNNIRLQDQDIVLVKSYKTRVELKGEVKNPAIFEVKESEHIIDAIDFAGGFTDKAYSFRLKIVRNTDRQHKFVDIENKQFASFPLENGDILSVDSILSTFENRVEIQGAVFRPGQFELTKGMTLKGLINSKAEGLKGDAFLNRAIVYRTNLDNSIGSFPVDLNLLMNGQSEDVILIKDDIIKVFSIYDLQEGNFLSIDGEVNKPGQYPFIKEFSLGDLIALAGGFKESASLAKIEVARRIKNSDPNSKSAKIADVYLFNISKELNLSDSASKFVLQPYDQVSIRRSPGYEIQAQASIVGEVQFPGSYSIKTKDEYISDLIIRAGGLTAEAFPKGAFLSRKMKLDQKLRSKALKSLKKNEKDSLMLLAESEVEQSIGINLEKILKNPHSKYDILLKEGDVLNIPKELQTVTLSGAFLYPISVRYDKSFGFRKYASMAGGFADEAKRSKAFVVYANGSVDKTTSFLGIKFYPKIEPGAEIIVPKKPEIKNKMTLQESIGLATAITSVITGIVTVRILTK